ncbi:MAG: 23S rRNA (pseudouridine(1915)-N(3))-methyltransferase RlmH [Negativicutes bacterium]|jgi:23S rRNA (pseudouridine1915-N3)-methyltransferase
MKISIVAIGKIKEKYLRDGIAEYLKRLTLYCKLDIVELAEERMPENPGDKEKAACLEKEGERILQNVRVGSVCIVLDVAGKNLASEQLAAELDRCGICGQSDITFVIGGAFGLSRVVRARAEILLSFSKMTFTHQMIRLLLVEQIYRAFKIIRREKYHN